MALHPADIATVSRLLDDALALDPAEWEPWLAALPAEHQRHTEALRDMLAQEAQLDTDPRLEAMPKLSTDDAVAQAGDRIGPYRLLHEIGRGGMGSVWLAERADGAYRRQVALKLPRLAWGAGLAECMVREREIGMLLEHPNIARLYDAGVDERGRPFLALEYVEGQPIDAWCEAHGLSVRDRLRLFVQVVKAVAYAHGRLVVHRDLKPSNVLVTPDGQAHLLDFGIAKLLDDAARGDAWLTQEQGRVLTPHYASPEQVAGEAITVQSDVYSLGVLLYELLTGTMPIAPKRSTLGAVEEAILQGDAPPASSRVKDRATAKALRGEVDAILAKAMQREPGRRYGTADALAQDIERHLNGETVTARPDSVAYRLRKAVRRHWVGVVAAAAVLVAVLTGSGVAVVQAQRAARSAERERVVKDFVADVFRFNSRVDPKNAAVRPVSTQTLIEGGAQLIQQRFAGQPELQAELFGVVGGVFSDMGAYKLAADYATRRSEALATLRADPMDQARALLALGQALFDDRHYADAEPRARRVLELADRGTPTYLGALVLLGRIQDAQSRRDALIATVKQLDEQVAMQATGPTSALAWVTFLHAREVTYRNHFDEAIPMYQRAIDLALASEGPTSLTAVAMRLKIANRLAQTTFTDQAQIHFDAATAALRQLGGAHEVRAAFEAASFAERRRVGFHQISAADALAVLEHSRAELTGSNMPIPEWFVAQVDFWRGSVLTEAGEVGRAMPLLQGAEAALKRSLPTVSDRFWIAMGLGWAELMAGRHELADVHLREVLEMRGQMGGGRDPYAAGDYATIAENLLMQGRTREAEAILDEAPQFEPIRGEGLSPDRYNRFVLHMRALTKLADGHAADALRILQSAPPSVDDGADDWGDYHGKLGEALCATGQHIAGLNMLRQSIATDENAGYFAHAPWLARRRALAGLCAAASGDRAVALRYAAAARADFTAQPGVSPYYKAPLVKLERALGWKPPPV